MFNNILPNIFPGAVQLGANVNPSPPDIPDGAITTMNGDMIILSTGGDYVLTVNGFVPLNALSMHDGSPIKTVNNEFIII